LKPRRLAALVPIGALLAASWAVRLPYYSEGPGPAKDVEPLIRVTGHQRFASSGHFILTSVLIQSLNVFQAVSAWLDPHRDVVDESAFLAPGETEQQADQRAVSEMDQSKIDATVVALSRVAGYPEHHGRGILVESVGSDCPAGGKLFPGDLIDHVNGRPITSSDDFERILDSTPPEQPVRLAGTAGGERFDVTLVRRPCSGSKQPLVGISSVPAFPFRVSISSGDIGGPSAGLMWALGLYDLLTPGDLTGGRIVAGTGVIALDGTVGPIGGVQQKIVAAEQEGAEVFLVPVANLAEARAAPDDLRLVPVKTFGQALRFLRSRG
jgi:PDZ domain-containing protein